MCQGSPGNLSALHATPVVKNRLKSAMLAEYDFLASKTFTKQPFGEAGFRDLGLEIKSLSLESNHSKESMPK